MKALIATLCLALVVAAVSPAEGASLGSSLRMADVLSSPLRLDPDLTPLGDALFAGGVSTTYRAGRPQQKKTLLAWFLSMVVLPGAGQVYVGGPFAITVGVVHFAVTAGTTVWYALADKHDVDTLLAIGIVSLVNWVLNWVDAILLCELHKSGERPVKTGLTCDPDTATVGLYIGYRF